MAKRTQSAVQRGRLLAARRIPVIVACAASVLAGAWLAPHPAAGAETTGATGTPPAAFAAQSLPANPVGRARQLAYTRRRAEALDLLSRHLAGDPDDNEARVLYGTVLSWEGRYDEARSQLQQVLAVRPTHGDALAALVNVELWSDHPDRAEAISRELLVRQPDNTDVLLSRARALRALGRGREARPLLERVLKHDPDNQAAASLLEGVENDEKRWMARADYTTDRFNDTFDPWHEVSASLKRLTGWGSLIGRYTRAHRFGENDDLVEVEGYPRLRTGTYAFVGVGYSPRADFFPRHRFAVDIYQSLPASFEISAGYRRLAFDNAVNIYTAYLGKYLGNYLISGRVYVTPGGGGTSHSYHLSARRYFADNNEYIGVRYAHGASREEVLTRTEVETLYGDTLAFELSLPVGRGWGVAGSAIVSRQDRVDQSDLRQTTLSAGVYYRF